MKPYKFQFIFMCLLGIVLFSCKPKEPHDPEDPSEIKTDPSTIAPDNLIAYFPFEGNALDLINELEPSKEEMVAYTGGKTGKAYKGMENAYLLYDIPETSKLRSLENGFTVASWIKGTKVNDTIYPQILGMVEENYPTKRNLSWQQNILKNKEGMFFQWSFKGNDTIYWVNKNRNDSVNKIFNPDTWLHIIMTCNTDNNTVNVYKDGIRIQDLTNSISGMNLNFQHSNKLVIGGWLSLVTKIGVEKWMDWFRGSLDELRIYDRGLTEEEAGLLYKAEKSQAN